ncbi:hypothetical protein C2E23DRAFT_513131 [Lenzites betulinus]|nr:hypothetical protein C2E23DRAFT_513131 [Lenzites betulinus]
MAHGLSFTEFEGGVPTSEQDRWNRFADGALLPNPQRRDMRLEYDAKGRPLMPNWDDEWNRLQAADVIHAYFAATWSRSHKPLDYADVQMHPERFLPPTWQAMNLVKPASLKMGDLARLHDLVYTAQDGDKPFTFELRTQDEVQDDRLSNPPTTPHGVTTFASPAQALQNSTPCGRNSSRAVSVLVGQGSASSIPSILERPVVNSTALRELTPPSRVGNPNTMEGNNRKAKHEGEEGKVEPEGEGDESQDEEPQQEDEGEDEVEDEDEDEEQESEARARTRTRTSKPRAKWLVSTNDPDCLRAAVHQPRDLASLPPRAPRRDASRPEGDA